jgi:hypothetical protein
MDLLTTITILGALITFISGIVSQVAKTSIEVKDQTVKQLTPGGWLLLGIALVGLVTSVASILIGVNIKNNVRLLAKAEETQKRALQVQEERWRYDMGSLLKIAKDDIEKNLGNTITGFRDSQERFNRTQAEIVSSRQSVLESNLHHTNEIIVAGQSLTSLHFNLQFDSASPELWQRMKEGQDEIDKNNLSGQGGVPAVSFEAVEYDEALIPLFSYLARIADGKHPQDKTNSTQSNGSLVVLMPLDESENAILSFGKIDSDISWFKGDGESLISAGFLDGRGFKAGNSTPSVVTNLATNPKRGTSSYVVHWDLDPNTLAKSINRRNLHIPPTAKLPRIFKVAILHTMKILPFRHNNFAEPHAANLWNDVGINRHELPIGPELRNAVVNLEVNRVRQTRYALKRIYTLDLIDENDDEFETSCTLLEFEAT